MLQHASVSDGRLAVVEHSKILRLGIRSLRGNYEYPSISSLSYRTSVARRGINHLQGAYSAFLQLFMRVTGVDALVLIAEKEGIAHTVIIGETEEREKSEGRKAYTVSHQWPSVHPSLDRTGIQPSRTF